MRSENSEYTRWINVRKGYTSYVNRYLAKLLLVTLNPFGHQHPSPTSVTNIDVYLPKDIHFPDCYQHGEINLQKVFPLRKSILLDMAFLSNSFTLTMNLFMKTILYPSMLFSSLLSSVIWKSRNYLIRIGCLTFKRVLLVELIIKWFLSRRAVWPMPRWEVI